MLTEALMSSPSGIVAVQCMSKPEYVIKQLTGMAESEIRLKGVKIMERDHLMFQDVERSENCGEG